MDRDPNNPLDWKSKPRMIDQKQYYRHHFVIIRSLRILNGMVRYPRETTCKKEPNSGRLGSKYG